MVHFTKNLAKKLKALAFASLLLTIASLSIAPSITAMTTINSSTIDRFLTNQLTPDITDIWEDIIVKIKSDSPSYTQELEVAFKSKTFKNLCINIQNSFAYFSGRFKQAGDLELKDRSLKRIKKLLSYFLKDLEKPEEFNNLAYIVSQAAESELYIQSGITTLSELVTAIGSAVSAYYKEEILLTRLKQDDAQISSTPLTPVLLEKAPDGSITVISLPGFRQDKLNKNLLKEQEKEKPWLIKALQAAPFIINELLSQWRGYVTLKNTYKSKDETQKLRTENTCHQILKTSPDMTKKEIHSAFNTLAQEYHPDRCTNTNKKDCTTIYSTISECDSWLRGKTKAEPNQNNLEKTYNLLNSSNAKAKEKNKKEPSTRIKLAIANNPDTYKQNQTEMSALTPQEQKIVKTARERVANPSTFRFWIPTPIKTLSNLRDLLEKHPTNSVVHEAALATAIKAINSTKYDIQCRGLNLLEYLLEKSTTIDQNIITSTLDAATKASNSTNDNIQLWGLALFNDLLEKLGSTNNDIVTAAQAAANKGNTSSNSAVKNISGRLQEKLDELS